MNKPVIILGAGGHAKVLLDCLILAGRTVTALVDKNEISNKSDNTSILLVCEEDLLNNHPPHIVDLIIGIGSVRAERSRQQLFEKFVKAGYDFASVSHPSATVAKSVQFDVGTQIMAGAIIQADAHIGQNSIVNTGASIDHDCQIGNHCHIAPGAILSGNVTVGDRSIVGAGATVIQGVTIGADVTVGAGAVVLTNITSRKTVYGAPARPAQRS